LPAAIHGGGLNDLVVRDTSVGLKDQSQGELSGRDGRLALGSIFVEGSQLVLEGVREEGMTMVAQKDKELGASDPFEDREFSGHRLNGRVPEGWTHGVAPFLSERLVVGHHAITSDENT
jgi:hypothetical protein